VSKLVATSADTPKIQPGCRVKLHFSLLLPSGEEIDTTRRGKPASLIVGDGNLLPGFEAAIEGMRAGDAEQITLPAEDAFGERNPGNVQLLAKSKFGQMLAEEPLQPGLVVSFQAPDGELPGVVQEVYEDTVKVDFNHPLSGTSVVFDVSIIEVERPGFEPTEDRG
jgi:FKBP-type peptidyl-prolyl cis-trans isomerase SlpA